jgi:hypothetical protein
MDCKTLDDFKNYLQTCSTEELLTLSKDCDFAHTNNYFKENSMCDTIFWNIYNDANITKAIRIVACPMILYRMCEFVAYEVMHRIANNTLKVGD